MTALLVNVLDLAAKAVELTDCAYIVAVSAAMDVAGTSDPYVFADALQAINTAPEGRCRAQRVRDAAAALRAEPGLVPATNHST